MGELPPEGVVCGVVPPLDGVVAPLEGDVDPLWVVPVPLVEVVLELLAGVVLLATEGGAVGTLNAGTPAVSAVPVPPPPQAASPSPSAIATTVAGIALDLRASGGLGT